ncbi:hypothetical protein, partial [Leptospira interrogans]|uniref:hypothetical protein n=1 Tax=Leptospira interrogans TaxID=173 RepID=UPI001E631596
KKYHFFQIVLFWLVFSWIEILKKSQILLSSYNKPIPLKTNLFFKTNRVNANYYILVTNK